MSTYEIEAKIAKLPAHTLPEINDFIDFLLAKYGQEATEKEQGAFEFNWEGGLSDISNKSTSVELQHKAMDWR